MKEQILHLDPHDDFLSARDKMGWVQTERVLLVWPARGQVLQRKLDLVLLHRHAHRLGAHLGLVTADDSIRDYAADLGVPVFPSVEASRKMKWRSRVPRLKPDRRQPPPDPQAIRARRAPPRSLPRWADWVLKFVFFILGLSGVLALAYALIPAATITLTPASHALTVTAELVADANLTQAEATTIPARLIRVEVEDAGLTPTTGTRDVPDKPATGVVVFTNIAGTAASIPAGTGVRTTSGASIRFVTTKAANLEGRIGAAVEVPIKAVDPGPAGNVPGGLINAIDGPLGLQLAVTNPAATQNGTVTQKAAVVEADRALVRAELLEKLRLAAVTAVQAQLQPGEFLVADSITITRVIAETYDHSVGEAADTINLTLRLAASGLVINENDARLVAQDQLTAQVPADASLLAGQTQFVRAPALSLDAEGRAHFTVTITGATVPRIDPGAIQRLVQNQTLAEASRRLLTELSLAQPPRLELRPAWYAQAWPRLPVMLFRIEVIVAGQ